MKQLTGTRQRNILAGSADDDLILGLQGDDRLLGQAGNDRLYGGGGRDRLVGGSGNDWLDGGQGADVMVGGGGIDRFVVDDPLDDIQIVRGTGTETVLTTVDRWTMVADPGLDHLILLGTANLSATGNALANEMTGNAGNNSFDGLDGDDRLSGGAGSDRLVGGAGNDTLDGGVGADVMVGTRGNDVFIVDTPLDDVVIVRSAGTKTVKASIDWDMTLDVGLDNLELTETADLNGFGNPNNNRITGNRGNNQLEGREGDDTLVGGGGSDRLTGGSGSDRFVFNAPDEAVDIITDFAVNPDKIELRGNRFNLSQRSGALNPSAFSLGAVAIDRNQRLIYTATTGALWFDPDGSDAAPQQLLAQMSTALALTASQFNVGIA